MDRCFAIFCVFAFAISSDIVAQPAPPYGLTQCTQEHSTLVYWFYPQVNDTVLVAFDGDPQSYLFYSSQSVGARLAVGIDLTSRACAVEAVEIRLWPTDPFPQHSGNQNSPFRLGIYSRLDPDSSFAALWQDENCSTAGDGAGWQSFPVRRRILSDSLYLEFEWKHDTPTAPLPSVVYAGGFVGSYSGHIEDGRLIWNPVNDAAVLMRLRVSESDLQSTISAGEDLPDSFSVLVFDSPSDEAYSEPQVLTVRDSLHIELDREEVEGKYVVVAAWQNDVLSPKSEMIRIDAATSVRADSPPENKTATSQNFPNPFNSETIVESSQPDAITIFDLLGRRIATLLTSERTLEGNFSFRWGGLDSSGRPVPSGVYFYRQNGSSCVGKMLLLK